MASLATDIEWCDWCWNILRGCTEESPGCVHCYARGIAHRFGGVGKPFEGLTFKSEKTGKVRWTGKIQFVEKDLELPVRRKEPSRIFVNSMSDCFHKNVKFEWLDLMFGVIQRANWHTYLILTKHPARMLEYVKYWEAKNGESFDKAFPNVWLGVSVEDQKRALERIPILLSTPAAVRFLSCEPLLEDIDLSEVSVAMGSGYHPMLKLDWIIVGGESGVAARRMPPSAAIKLVTDCQRAEISLFFKQTGKVLAKEWGLEDSKGGNLEEIPDNRLPARVKVREFPSGVSKVVKVK